MKMIARKNFKYFGKVVRVGDEFEARPGDVKVLKTIKRAVDAAHEVPAVSDAMRVLAAAPDPVAIEALEPAAVQEFFAEAEWSDEITPEPSYHVDSIAKTVTSETIYGEEKPKKRAYKRRDLTAED